MNNKLIEKCRLTDEEIELIDAGRSYAYKLINKKLRKKVITEHELALEYIRMGHREQGLLSAQLTKAIPIIRAEERERYQKYMMGFPSSLYPISENCLCLKWNCKWFEEYEKPPDAKQFPIGWCQRYKPDPDAGYVIAYQLPPCVVWAVERKALKEGEA